MSQANENRRDYQRFAQTPCSWAKPLEACQTRALEATIAFSDSKCAEGFSSVEKRDVANPRARYLEPSLLVVWIMRY